MPPIWRDGHDQVFAAAVCSLCLMADSLLWTAGITVLAEAMAACATWYNLVVRIWIAND